MNSLDNFQSLINRFNRELIGFDVLNPFDTARLSANVSTGGTYPPYNVEKVNDTSYRITLAVAGFDESNLDITLEKNVLSIKGNNSSDPTEQEDRTFLYRGIAERSFERTFTLSEWIRVANTTLKNGLLTIDLVREIPEEAKPKKIPITSI